jgi:hypothetical protein
MPHCRLLSGYAFDINGSYIGLARSERGFRVKSKQPAARSAICNREAGGKIFNTTLQHFS